MTKQYQTRSATDHSGQAQVEQDHSLVHMLGYQLGQHYPHGGHEAGKHHQTIPCNTQAVLNHVPIFQHITTKWGHFVGHPVHT